MSPALLLETHRRASAAVGAATGIAFAGLSVFARRAQISPNLRRKLVCLDATALMIRHASRPHVERLLEELSIQLVGSKGVGQQNHRERDLGWASVPPGHSPMDNPTADRTNPPGIDKVYTYRAETEVKGSPRDDINDKVVMHSRVLPLVSFAPEPGATLFDVDPSARLRPLKTQARRLQSTVVPHVVAREAAMQPEVMPVSNTAIMDTLVGVKYDILVRVVELQSSCADSSAKLADRPTRHAFDGLHHRVHVLEDVQVALGVPSQCAHPFSGGSVVARCRPSRLTYMPPL